MFSSFFLIYSLKKRSQPCDGGTMDLCLENQFLAFLFSSISLVKSTKISSYSSICSKTSRLVHASSLEPPQLECIIPTGTLSSSYTDLAKKNPTALNDVTSSPTASIQ